MTLVEQAQSYSHYAESTLKVISQGFKHPSGSVMYLLFKPFQTITALLQSFNQTENTRKLTKFPDV